MFTLSRFVLTILAAYVATLAAVLDPAAREVRALAAVKRGAVLDPSEIRCEARATAEPDNPDPCHVNRTARAGTRDREPVNAAGCPHCGRSQLELRADAGDQHAARDLAGTPAPRRPWLERS